MMLVETYDQQGNLLSSIEVPDPPDPEPSIEVRLAAVEAQAARAGKVEAALVEKAVISAKDVDDAVAVEAEPVERLEP